jgi:hypothetical protein
MQDGSVTIEPRKRGPDVWCFRWRECGPDGRKIHRRIVLGTAVDLKSIGSARKAVVGLRREINVNDVRIRRESMTVADLSTHFQQQSLCQATPALPTQPGKLTRAISRSGSSLGGVNIGCWKFGLWKLNHG